MGRAPCCDKSSVKRGPWSPEEDATLKSYLEKHGTGGNWIALPPKAGLNRCGKSCRLRWLNYLRPHIKLGGFTEEEDEIIYNLYSSIGSRWSLIAAQFPGRTDNDVKNHWNTKLKKKFLAASSSTIVTGNTISKTSCPDQFSAFTFQPQVDQAFFLDQKRNSACFVPNNVLDLEPAAIPVPLTMPLETEASSYTESSLGSNCNTPPFKEVSVFSSAPSLAEQNSHVQWYENGHEGEDDGVFLEFVLEDLLNHGFASLDKSSQVAPSSGNQDCSYSSKS